MLVWCSPVLLGVPARILAVAALCMLSGCNSPGINPVAVTDCSYLAEESSLIPLSLYPRPYPNSLSREAGSSLYELGAGLASPLRLWKLRLCCRTPRPSVPISSTFALCTQRGFVRVVWLILCLCLQSQCNLRAVMQEDPGSSLSPVFTAWPPPPGERPWLWLCPCIPGCGVKELSLALPGWQSLAGMGEIHLLLVLFRTGLSVEDRLLLKIKVSKAAVGDGGCLRMCTLRRRVVLFCFW